MICSIITFVKNTPYMKRYISKILLHCNTVKEGNVDTVCAGPGHHHVSPESLKIKSNSWELQAAQEPSWMLSYSSTDTLRH